MKYSKNFDRDYNWYFKYREEFNFCGSIEPKFKAIEDINGVGAKEALFSIDTHGKNIPTKEPLLLNELLLCKAGINFQIKQWAEGRAEGLLPLVEFSQKEAHLKYGIPIDNNVLDIQHEYELLDWMIVAVENQKGKFYK